MVFCLVGVATPNELVKDRRTTPTMSAAPSGSATSIPRATTSPRWPQALHADPATAQPLLARVLYWTGGHPFLTLRLVKDARERVSPTRPPSTPWSSAAYARLDRLGEDVHIQSILRFVAERLTDGGATLALYERILGGAAAARPADPDPRRAQALRPRAPRPGRPARDPQPDLRPPVRPVLVRASRPLHATRRYRGAAIAAGIALLLTVGGGTAWFSLRLSPEIAGLERGQNTASPRARPCSG